LYELAIKTKHFFKYTFWNFNWRHKLIAHLRVLLY